MLVKNLIFLSLFVACTPNTPQPSQAPKPASPPAVAQTLPLGLDAATDKRARQTVEQLYGPVLGGVDIVDISAESGLLHATFRQHGHIDGKPLTVWLSLDGKLAFPLAWNVAERAQQIQTDQRLVSCARAKGVRVYGDPRQPGTAKQLDEFGPFGRGVLVDCSATPDECKLLGQTALPVTAIAGQRLAEFVPRAQIEKLSGCP